MQNTYEDSPTGLLLMPEPGAPVSVIMKLAGESCNINCHYCYEKRKPYPTETRLTPELLRRFLRLCGDRPVHAELHGGEPLIVGRRRMAALLAELRAYPGPVTLAIQTNGTILDDRWIAFLQEEWPDLDIGVSLDGPAGINDRHRVGYRDRGTAQRTEDAIRRLGEQGHAVGVIATVARPSLGREREIIEYFQGFAGLTYLKFSPCLDFDVQTKMRNKGNLLSLQVLNASGQGMPGWSTTPMEFAEFLVKTFDVWREEAFRQFLLEPVYSVMRTLAGRRPSLCHFSEQKCSFVMTLYPDGRLGSCDELRMPDAQLGHVDDFDDVDQALTMQTNPILQGKLGGLLEKCAGCSLHDTCGGGCLATRLQYVGTPFDDEYCAYRARVIEHVRSVVDAAEPQQEGTQR